MEARFPFPLPTTVSEVCRPARARVIALCPTVFSPLVVHDCTVRLPRSHSQYTAVMG